MSNQKQSADLRLRFYRLVLVLLGASGKLQTEALLEIKQEMESEFREIGALNAR